MAGWDKQEGGSVYAIPLGATLVKVPFTIGGSGSAYIYGLCDKLWRVRAFWGSRAFSCESICQRAALACGSPSPAGALPRFP